MKNSKIAILVAASAALLNTPAQASILLQIDISNPAAVIISATGSGPLANDSSMTVNDGIALRSFMASPSAISNGDLSNWNLRPNGVVHGYNKWNTDDFGSGMVDLLLFRNTSPDTFASQTFLTGEAAFNGETIADLSTLALQPIGYSGLIINGLSSNQGSILGNYIIVPEPASAGLLVGLLALSSIFVMRRRR